MEAQIEVATVEDPETSWDLGVEQRNLAAKRTGAGLQISGEKTGHTGSLPQPKRKHGLKRGKRMQTPGTQTESSSTLTGPTLGHVSHPSTPDSP